MKALKCTNGGRTILVYPHTLVIGKKAIRFSPRWEFQVIGNTMCARVQCAGFHVVAHELNHYAPVTRGSILKEYVRVFKKYRPDIYTRN